MKRGNIMSERIMADVNPTKGFFINMLTRDIELNDAILDLLDNCLDGVVRIRAKEGKERNSKDFYSGFIAKIYIKNDSFVIEDNCGGIPLEIAKEKAFRMGRDKSTPREESATVGIYGIGMKRAIFKIGRSATVKSVTPDDSFIVTIPKDWETQEEWKFPIEMIDREDIDVNGTRIEIREINETIGRQWSEEGHLETYISELIGHIKKSYSLIIERGFKVEVNGQTVEGEPVSFVWSENDKGIKPYVYRYEKDGVFVRVAVGFYAAPPTVDESDSMAEKTPRRATADAGWTVICNDRVVLYNNKDHLTGWGENGVPKYHTQFIGIRGIAEFISKEPEKLPMTTTKRGVDLASPLYALVKKKMCEGLKIFTNFTNDWKGTANADTEYFKRATHKTIDEIMGEKANPDVHYRRTSEGGEQAKPSLPKPEKRGADTVWVRFAVRENECKLVSSYLFEEERIPSEVGAECFNRILTEAKA